MLRYIGAALIVAACAYAGAWKTASVKKDLAAVSELAGFAAFAERRIADRRQPLPDIYADYSEISGGALSLALARGGWEEAAPLIPEPLRGEAILFGTRLGGGFSSEEALSCRAFAEKLEAEKRRLTDALSNKAPLFRSLWIIAGLAAVIILL